MGEGEFA